MKFLCDNCKAKYQIADEKVVGRTVRMKCRKCGHLIEIRASVTESSVAKAPDAAAETSSGDLDSSSPVAPAAAAAAEKKPGAPTPRPATTTGAKKAPTPGPSAGAKPGTTSLRGVAGGAAAKPAAASAKASGGLASAFNRSVKDEPTSHDDSGATKAFDAKSLDARALDMTSQASTEEWYVGVNGVPVGPVRLAELRSKAASGAVTEESLVWREGFEEWLPLRTFPDLVALVRQAQGVDPHSMTPAPGSVKPSSLSNPGASARRSQPPPGRSNVIPFAGRTATAEKLDEEPAAAMADPFAAPVPVAAPHEPPRDDDRAAAAIVVPPAAPLPSEYPAPRRASGGIPIAAWIAIVLAMATGVVAGSVFFSKSPPPPTVQIVTVTATSTAAPPSSAAIADTTKGPTEILPDNSASTHTGPKVAAAGTGAKAPDTAPSVGNVPSIPNVGMPGIPTLTPGASPTPGVADKLTSADLERVINGGRNGLKRACWEPALGAKSASAPNSARVSVALTIGTDGHVQSAVPSGGDGYPTLGGCIASRIRNWVFPQAGAPTQATPVFNFVAQ